MCCYTASCAFGRAKGREEDAGWWGDGGELRGPLGIILVDKRVKFRVSVGGCAARDSVYAGDGGKGEKGGEDVRADKAG